jgi:hypothetical protein
MASKDPVRKAVRKAAPRRARKAVAPAVTHDDIATRAYFIALEEGGDAFDNWLRAEREIVAA